MYLEMEESSTTQNHKITLSLCWSVAGHIEHLLQAVEIDNKLVLH